MMNKVVVNTLLISFLFIAQTTIAATVNLKLLVIASGTPEQDLGLDYIDDALDDIGVPYDVLNASQEDLTLSTLVTEGIGNYSGIILTDTFLYYTGEGNYLNSALTLDEWKILHNYEREYNVRESVIAGDPISGDYYRANYDLDYGMNSELTEVGTSFTANWENAANEAGLYTYINTNSAVEVTDYALATTPSLDPEGPTVLPLLTDSTSGKTLISELTYADGRKVLLSTITQAPFLLYSQILNYEFINYASQGVFIGAREIYLSAHVDDLFAADSLWDPVTNTTSDTEAYRNTANDINIVAQAQKTFVENNKNFAGFKLDIAFNGGYAVAPVNDKVTLTSTHDTSISSYYKNYNTANKTTAKVKGSWWSQNRALFNFDVSKTNPATKSILTLRTVKTWHSYFYRGKGKICLTTAAWDNNATWKQKKSQSLWSKLGGDYSAQNCVYYKDNWGSITADISTLVTMFQSSDNEEFGLIFIPTNGASTYFYTKEASSYLHPKLTIDYSTSGDALTQAVIDNKDEFRFINHTLTHRDMYTSAGATYDVALYEIAENLNVWQTLGLPGFEKESQTLVTGNHSGLEDTPSSNVPNPVLINFPEGLNLDLMDAVQDVGIKYFASDASRVNQAVEAYIPGTDILMLPRFPTQVFYNVTTPENMVDEYNYIYNESYTEQGLNPCEVDGAVCTPLTYEGLLDYEANLTLRHMLSFKAWPHYFHISNLRDYDNNGATLQFDWLKAVAKEYNKYINLPVRNLDFFTIGEITKDKLAAKAANVTGYWDKAAGTITLKASNNVNVAVTGAQNGELYGTQKILRTNIDFFETTLAVEPAQ